MVVVLVVVVVVIYIIVVVYCIHLPAYIRHYQRRILSCPLGTGVVIKREPIYGKAENILTVIFSEINALRGATQRKP